MSARSPAAIDWEFYFSPKTPVIALPSWSRPRLLVPSDTIPGRMSGGAFYPAFRATGRLFRLAMRLKAISGFGSRLSVSRGSAGLADFLADLLPDARVRAVQVGVPGNARKFTLQLADPSGCVVGYLKCADSPLGRRRLRHEHRLLGALPAGAGPDVLKYGSVSGHDLLLLRSVPGRTVRPSVSPPAELYRFTCSLLLSDRCSIDDHPWVRANAGASVELLEPLDALSRHDWPVAIQHGDLAPWNLIANRAGRLTAIDWEYGLEAGFPGLDIAQYVLQVAALICRWPPDRARDFAIRQLQRDDRLAPSRREAAAIVALAAYQAQQNAAADGHPAEHPMQVWRRAIREQRP